MFKVLNIRLISYGDTENMSKQTYLNWLHLKQSNSN